jgi:hypothetical protein
MTKTKYVRCPRCDLNYMDSRQEMCDVCKAELGLSSSVILDDDDFDDMDLEEGLTKLCPICKRTYINLEEDMCETCAAAKENADLIDSSDEEWRNFLDDDPEEYEEEKIEIPLEELQEEEEEAEEEDTVIRDEENDDIENDFEFDDDLDDIDDFDDEDYDDDFDDLDDEDDLEEKPKKKKSKNKETP